MEGSHGELYGMTVTEVAPATYIAYGFPKLQYTLKQDKVYLNGEFLGIFHSLLEA